MSLREFDAIIVMNPGFGNYVRPMKVSYQATVDCEIHILIPLTASAVHPPIASHAGVEYFMHISDGGQAFRLRVCQEITDSVARGRSLTVAALNAHRSRDREGAFGMVVSERALRVHAI